MNTLDHYFNALALASVQIVAAQCRGADIRPYVDAALSLEPPELLPPNQVDRVYALAAVLVAQIDEDTTLTERMAKAARRHPDVIAACQKRREAA